MTFPPEELIAALRLLLDEARAAGVTIATAESCTGGLMSAALTEIPGSSAVFDCGFITYSYESKSDILGVDNAVIVEHGAVSEPVAKAMAEGALARSHAKLAVAITGVAGPGGIPEKPAGLVHFALAVRGGETVNRVQRFGDIGRSYVRMKSVLYAVDLLREGIRNLKG
ncbi:MAG: CinA family protein [Maricaulaceae bacterium]|nr:CinA family protein [Maricaulaceae bacterium]